MITKQI